MQNKPTMKTATKELVTVYTSSSFGISKFEGKLVDFGTTKYAQYNAAPFIKYVPKGKRNVRGFVKTYQPYIIIIKGVNHPEPADAFTAPKTTVYEMGVVTSRMSRYSSFDERYKTEFDAKISEYLQSQTVLMDVRHTVSTCIINGGTVAQKPEYLHAI